MRIFTGRQSATEPGDVKNALFQYVEAFIPDAARVAELKDRYTRGDNIGDGHIKKEVAEAINTLLAPMQKRRAALEGRPRSPLFRQQPPRRPTGDGPEAIGLHLPTRGGARGRKVARIRTLAGPAHCPWHVARGRPTQG